MNVSCTSCSAKYAVPDEKVRGKKVKITCKHCGTGIIVDGTKLDAAAAADAAKPPAAAAPAAPAAAPAQPAQPSFDIAYPDDRQETLSVSQIVDKYAAGAIDEEAFLWREGMADWKAPFDIPELASALAARGVKKKQAALAAPAPVSDEEEATRVQSSPFDVPGVEERARGEWREPAKEAQSSPEAAFDLKSRSALPFETPEPAPSPKAGGLSPKPAVTTSAAVKPAAARRSAARGGGDLFGDLAAVGSEDDESLGSEAKEAHKMTGARNESSVLFSLDALVKQEKQPATKKPAPKQEDAAAFLMGTDSAPSSIASVGTGSFGSAFAAPDFTAPVAAAPPEVRAVDPMLAMSAAPTKKKGMGLWIGLGVVVVAIGGAFAAGLPAKLSGAAAPAPTPSATAAAAAPPEPAPAPAPTPTPVASAAPSAAGSEAAAASAAPATSPTPPASDTATKPTEAAKPSEAAASKPAEPEKPAEKPAEAAKPAEKPAAPSGDAPPFDKAAAIAALSAAAGNAQSCKTADGPTGSGKVSITFMPSGRPTNTQVSGDLAGTAVGGCVARLFRSTKIPAFSGDAVTVSKSFSVQ